MTDIQDGLQSNGAFPVRMEVAVGSCRACSEVFASDSEPDVAFRERLLPHLAEPRTICVFHSPEETIFRRWDSFQALVAERDKRIRVEKVIADQSGKKIFVLVKVVEERDG